MTALSVTERSLNWIQEWVCLKTCFWSSIALVVSSEFSPRTKTMRWFRNICRPLCSSISDLVPPHDSSVHRIRSGLFFRCISKFLHFGLGSAAGLLGKNSFPFSLFDSFSEDKPLSCFCLALTLTTTWRCFHLYTFDECWGLLYALFSMTSMDMQPVFSLEQECCTLLASVCFGVMCFVCTIFEKVKWFSWSF